MSDDDLIKRGDALDAIKPIYGWSITAAEGVWSAVAALPAVSAPDVAELVEALRAFKAFDDMPTEAKRPDVFEMKVRQPILAALAKIGATP